jgi:hypothetical protein
MHRTLAPDSARAVATPAQTDVFPVPPLPDSTAINSPTVIPPFSHSHFHYKAISHKRQEEIQLFSSKIQHYHQKHGPQYQIKPGASQNPTAFHPERPAWPAARACLVLCESLLP